jgi:hypothetical protein
MKDPSVLLFDSDTGITVDVARETRSVVQHSLNAAADNSNNTGSDLNYFKSPECLVEYSVSSIASPYDCALVPFARRVQAPRRWYLSTYFHIVSLPLLAIIVPCEFGGAILVSPAVIADSLHLTVF